MARDFEGGTAYEIEIPSGGAEFGIGTLSEFSLSLWANPNSNAESAFCYVSAVKGLAAGEIIETYFDFTAANFRCGAKIGGTYHSTGIAFSNIPADTWTFFTWSYTSADGVLRGYYNGVEDTGDQATGITGSLASLDDEAHIGNNAAGTANKHFRGSIADYCHWDRQLTVPEMMAMAHGASMGTFGPVLWVPCTGVHDPEPDWGPEHLSWTVNSATKAADPPRTLFPRWRPAQTRAVAAASTTSHRLMTLGVGM